MNEEDVNETEINITRTEWLKCVGIAVGTFLVNHCIGPIPAVSIRSWSGAHPYSVRWDSWVLSTRSR